MARKLIAWACILVSMACLLEMLHIVIEAWASSSAWRNTLRLFALMGWVGIVYQMLTFKYKWLRRLANKKKRA